MKATRAVRAQGPRPDADSLRRAYLDLLKLCLCDLAGSGTASVEGLPGGGICSRELAGAELEQRVQGLDWPLHGLTMTGLLRLEDLQQLVEQVVNERIEGDLIEVGSWRGGASILMRAALDALGAEERRVWVADSFKGFPAPERQAAAPARYPATVEPYLAAFDFLAAPLDEVKQNFARFGCDRGVEFVEGFFADTLPRLQGRRWSLVRLDADTYDSTMLALSCLYPGLSAGGHLVVDDYGALEECRAAVEDFRSESRIEAPLEAVDEHCVRWRKGPAEELERRAAAEPPKGLANRNQPMPRGPRGRVPSARELELAERTEALERQLSELRSELARTRASASWRLTRPLRELASYIRARQR